MTGIAPGGTLRPWPLRTAGRARLGGPDPCAEQLCQRDGSPARPVRDEELR